MAIVPFRQDNRSSTSSTCARSCLEYRGLGCGDGYIQVDRLLGFEDFKGRYWGKEEPWDESRGSELKSYYLSDSHCICG